MAVDQRDAAGKLADLGQKLPRALLDHGRDMAEAVAQRDRDMAGQHHKHAGAGLAGLEQSFAVLVAAQFAEPAHALDLVARQRRKSLLEARKREGILAGRRIGCDRVCTHLATQKENRIFSGDAGHPASDRVSPDGYWPVFSPPASSRDDPVTSEDAAASSLRPRACDFL